METDYFFERLSNLIDRVETEYERVNTMWLQETEQPQNLSKIRVKHYPDTPALEEQTDEYRRFLAYHLDDSAFTSLSEQGFDVSYRIKTNDSIADKIRRYIFNPKLQGNAPVNKCLNDLCGVRVIARCSIPPQDVIEYVVRFHPELKITDSTKTQDGNVIYIATHIYFRKDNRTYPWELQVWSADDAELNLKSHREHKERYTGWNKR